MFLQNVNNFKILMNDNPRRLIRHAFFRRYVRVEVPCLHDDGNGILFIFLE